MIRDLIYTDKTRAPSLHGAPAQHISQCPQPTLSTVGAALVLSGGNPAEREEGQQQTDAICQRADPEPLRLQAVTPVSAAKPCLHKVEHRPVDL